MKNLIILAILVFTSIISRASSTDSTLYYSHKMLINGKEMPMESTFVISKTIIAWNTPSIMSSGRGKRIEYRVDSIQIRNASDGTQTNTAYSVTEVATKKGCLILVNLLGSVIEITDVDKNGKEFKITFPI